MASRILVADDEPALAKSTSLLLRDLGFDAIMETRAERILPALEASGATILLQDVRMPGLDIERHVQAIRAHPRLQGIVILLFSASLDVGEVASRLAVDGFIEKPFRPEALLALTRSATP